MIQLNKNILLLVGIASILCLGCGGHPNNPFQPSLMTEVSLLKVSNAPAPKQVSLREVMKVSLADKADAWNPFNYPDNSLEAKISYQLLHEEDALVMGSCIVRMQGKCSYSGERKIEWRFGDENRAPILPKWNARHRLKADQLIGNMNVYVNLLNGEGFMLSCDITSHWNNYRFSSHSSGETLFELEFSDFRDLDHFGYRFHGSFKKGDHYDLTYKSQNSLEWFGGAFPKEQSAAMEKDPGPLKITCYVGKGFKWSKERFDALGFEMYKYIYRFKNHAKALGAHAYSILRPIFDKPEVVIDKSIKDDNEFFWVLEYGDPVAG